MKIERLIGILSVLLQREKITAPELAERFEVSKRTIHRDIEALCNAGIPVCTTRGAGGGIQLMEGYRMDRTLLTAKDMRMLLAGLRSLDSVSSGNSYRLLMDKLKDGSSKLIEGSDIFLIDLSSWDKRGIAEKLETIQAAIEQHRVLSFDYYAPNGTCNRQIEPYKLLFKWSSWYVWGNCRLKQAFRLFKLNRMENICILNEPVPERFVPLPELRTEAMFPTQVHLKAVFEPAMQWHLLEHFGAASYTVQPDGTLFFEMDMDEEGLIHWLLSCGTSVTVLEPHNLRERLRSMVSEILAKYQ